MSFFYTLLLLLTFSANSYAANFPDAIHERKRIRSDVPDQDQTPTGTKSQRNENTSDATHNRLNPIPRQSTDSDEDGSAGSSESNSSRVSFSDQAIEYKEKKSHRLELEKSSRNGNAEATYQLANRYLAGVQGYKKNKEMVLSLFALAATQGHRNASYELAMYALNKPSKLKSPFLRGLEGDHDALSLMKLAANRGHPEAKFRLALREFSIDSTLTRKHPIQRAPNIESAINDLKGLAENGHPEARFMLSVRELGFPYPITQKAPLNRPGDIKKAVAELTELSDTDDHLGAKTELAGILLKGDQRISLQPDMPLGIRYFEEAASKKFPKAMLVYGFYLYEGRYNLVQNPIRGFSLVSQAAKSGLPSARAQIATWLSDPNSSAWQYFQPNPVK